MMTLLTNAKKYHKENSDQQRIIAELKQKREELKMKKVEMNQLLSKKDFKRKYEEMLGSSGAASASASASSSSSSSSSSSMSINPNSAAITSVTTSGTNTTHEMADNANRDPVIKRR